MENIKNIEMVSLTEDESMELNGGVADPVDYLIKFGISVILNYDGPGVPIQRYRDYY